MTSPVGMDAPGAFGLGQLREKDGESFVGLVVGDLVTRVDRFVPGITQVVDLFGEWDAHVEELGRVCARLGRDEPGAEGLRPWAELTVLPPITPRQVFQSGANYRSHVIDLMVARARESGAGDLDAVRAEAASMMDARIANDEPYVFIGLPSAMCGPFDDVELPSMGAQHDWELELAAVIGKTSLRVNRHEALANVAGYVVVNDLTTRDRVFRPDLPGIGTDWLAGKNAPTFLPSGPWLVPAAFVADPMDLHITLRLNDQVMQDESTADMLFDVARLIEHVSSIVPLVPGDLLLTGSPAGNGAHYRRYLREGDVIEGSITGLGTQRNSCVQAVR